MAAIGTWNRRESDDEPHRKRLRGDPNDLMPGRGNENVDMESAGSGTTVARVGNNAPAQGSRNTNNGETGIDPGPTYTLNPFVESKNVFMRYRTSSSLALAAGAVGSTSCLRETYRLNSIYDIKTTSAYVADPTAAADTADATLNLPQMRAYWSEFYRYWTVVKTHWKIKYWCTTSSSVSEPIMYVYFHGQQHPPVQNHLTDTRVEHYYRKKHKNMFYKKIECNPSSSTETSYFGRNRTVKEASGTFVPGSIDNLISEDEFQETWHKMTEVPSQRELMTIMFQRSERSLDTALTCNYELELTFEVQLRDLKAQYEYLTIDSAIPAIAGFAAITN